MESVKEKRNRLINQPINLLMILIILITMNWSCNSNDTNMKGKLNYKNSENWVSLPDVEKDVDVFYIYPTIYAGEDVLNMDITDPDLRQNAKGLLTAQAGVYSPYANIFAPFYRQQSGATQSMEPNNGGRNAFADPLLNLAIMMLYKLSTITLKILITTDLSY